MTILLLGYGSMGRRHAANARILGHTVVVCDTDPAKQAQAQADGYTLGDVTGTPYDVAIVATPAASHVDDVLRLRDVPILVEKPLALSVTDAERIPAERRKRIRVGYNWRFHPHTARLHEGINAREDWPTQVLTWVSTDMGQWPGRGYADPLLECSHEIDLALAFFGPITHLRAQYLDDGQKWHILLEHRARPGASARIMILTHAAPPHTRGVSVQWADGIEDGYSVESDDPGAPQGLAISYRAELADWLAWAECGAESFTRTFDQGTLVLKLCELARQQDQAHREAGFLQSVRH